MRFLIAFVVLMLAGAPALSQVVDDRTVVPGVRIGRWTLEASIGELLRVNGTPSTRPSIVGAFVPGVYWYSWDSLGLAAGTQDRIKTAYLALYDGRDYIVPRGVGVGATRSAVLAAHGEPTYETDLYVQGRTITLLAYDKSGLAFFIDKGVVQALLIFSPGGLQHLVAVC